MWIVPLALLILFEIIADIFAKEWSLKNKPIFWFGAILAYVIANTFWLFAIKNGSGLARGATIFSVVSAILAVVIGLIVYKEHVGTVEVIGMIVGVIAIILIFWQGIYESFFS